MGVMFSIKIHRKAGTAALGPEPLEDNLVAPSQMVP
jgi:hypothetical protein